MKFETFKLFVETIKLYNLREKELSLSIESFNTSYTIIEFVPCFYDNMISVIRDEFNDTADWFEHWLNNIYLEDCEDELLTVIHVNDRPQSIKTIEEIYNFLTRKI